MVFLLRERLFDEGDLRERARPRVLPAAVLDVREALRFDEDLLAPDLVERAFGFDCVRAMSVSFYRRGACGARCSS